MSIKKITIVDYGMGNLGSVISALSYIGATSIISSDPKEICKSDALLLPGVGSFRKAMESIKKYGLDEAILDNVKNRGGKILGICLGMQLMGLSSTEDGHTLGLGLIPSAVDKFAYESIGYNKIPHVGFNSVENQEDTKLFKGLKKNTDFYFVHSYRMLPESLDGYVATCSHSEIFLAAYECENIFATQFHPEKSQTNGLILLKNFLT
jgi:glutamine amidotransferase